MTRVYIYLHSRRRPTTSVNGAAIPVQSVAGMSRPLDRGTLVISALILGLLGYVAHDYKQRGAQRKQEEFERALAEWNRQRELTETLTRLNEQMERDECRQFVRSVALAPGLSNGAPVFQGVLLVCDDPQSGIRQRLRNGLRRIGER